MSEIIKTVMAVLSTTPKRWNQIAETLPADLMELTPAPGEWSAVQCLQHLVDTERVFFFRLGAFQRGEEFPAFNPDSEGSTAIPDALKLADEFDSQRKASLEALSNITEDDLGLHSRHQELGQVTLVEMLNEWAGHDLNHTVQAERALMQPFIRSCGPWQVYFQDQMVGSK